MAQFYNAHKPASKPPAEPSKFHPFVEKAKPKQATPEDLKRLFGPDWQRFA